MFEFCHKEKKEEKIMAESFVTTVTSVTIVTTVTTVTTVALVGRYIDFR